MSKPIKDGGQAFPRPMGTNGVSFSPSNAGMTLRDYFAAKALPSVYTYIRNNLDCEDDIVNLGVAKSAYAVADAMLKARNAK